MLHAQGLKLLRVAMRGLVQDHSHADWCPCVIAREAASARLGILTEPGSVAPRYIGSKVRSVPCLGFGIQRALSSWLTYMDLADVHPPLTVWTTVGVAGAESLPAPVDIPISKAHIQDDFAIRNNVLTL